MKRRGRPPLDPASVKLTAPVHVKLTAPDYDAADRLAKHARESIPSLMRRVLKHVIDHGKDYPK